MKRRIRTEYNKRYWELNKQHLKEIKKVNRQNKAKEIAKYSKTYSEKNKERLLIYREKRKPLLADRIRQLKYGIPSGFYERLKAIQENKCVICNEEKPLCVDHCHITKKVRGLLCRKCNSCLGLVNEKADILYRMAVYLACFPKSQEVT